MSYLLAHLLREIGRNSLLACLHALSGLASAHIFVFVREELAGLDRFLADRTPMVVGIAENRTVDFLKTLDHVLYNDALWEFSGVVYTLHKLAAVGCRADADRGAKIGRLHNHRITELRLDLFNNSVAASIPLVVGKPDVIYNGYSLGAENHLHRDLVHAVGRRESVAAGEGDSDRLEQSFEYTVLAVGAVKDGNGHMKSGHHLIFSWEESGVGLIEIVVTVFGTHEHFVGLGHKPVEIAVVLQVEKIAAGVPAALFWNVHRNYLIFVRIESVDGLYGRNDGDLMLDGATSEKDCYIGFHFLISLGRSIWNAIRRHATLRIIPKCKITDFFQNFIIKYTLKRYSYAVKVR